MLLRQESHKVDKGLSVFPLSTKSSRYCTYCNKHGHTLEFCYHKHCHPNFNKSYSFVNASFCYASLAKPTQGNVKGVSPISNYCLTQEHYAHLVFFI